MSTFLIDALKRYIVLEMIQNNSTPTTSDIMSSINSRAIEAAQTMKRIDEMFSRKPTFEIPKNEPNIFDMTSDKPKAQQPTLDEIVNFVKGLEENVVQLQQQMVDMNKQNFEGMRAVYEQLKAMTDQLSNKSSPN